MNSLRIAVVAGLAVGLAIPSAFGQPAPAPAAPPAPPKLVIARGGPSFLGVGIQEVDADRAKVLKLREEAGVEVTRVDADSPAEKAGLKAGDVITEYNGQRVEGLEQFSRMVRETPSGRDVKLSFMRNGVAQTATARIAARSASRININGPNINIPLNIRIPDVPTGRMTWRSSMLGIETESLDGQLAEFFGAKSGVLVRSVAMGSPAEKAGIKAGDVITKIGDGTVATPSEISSRLRSQQGNMVTFVLLRDKREMTVTVTLEQQNRGRVQPRPARRRAEIFGDDAGTIL